MSQFELLYTTAAEVVRTVGAAGQGGSEGESSLLMSVGSLVAKMIIAAGAGYIGWRLAMYAVRKGEIAALIDEGAPVQGCEDISIELRDIYQREEFGDCYSKWELELLKREIEENNRMLFGSSKSGMLQKNKYPIAKNNVHELCAKTVGIGCMGCLSQSRETINETSMANFQSDNYYQSEIRYLGRKRPAREDRSGDCTMPGNLDRFVREIVDAGGSPVDYIRRNSAYGAQLFTFAKVDRRGMIEEGKNRIVLMDRAHFQG